MPPAIAGCVALKAVRQRCPFVNQDVLEGQRAKWPGCGRGDALPTALTLAKQGHDRDAGQNDACAATILETPDRLDATLHAPVVGLDAVTQRGVLADLGRHRACRVSPEGHRAGSHSPFGVCPSDRSPCGDRRSVAIRKWRASIARGTRGFPRPAHSMAQPGTHGVPSGTPLPHANHRHGLEAAQHDGAQRKCGPLSLGVTRRWIARWPCSTRWGPRRSPPIAPVRFQLPRRRAGRGN
ncbi:hypothetical protein PSP31121_05097 [Pandoraea sputorum]|uniref:Uncharacterized protein n=1 Tax=Pandoraea sputorum TaxID=93222 RepID=A0A5E5BG14_9BURK|nr:hypothetical protein PSP31121_05097 [Pandoraea sputorum]